VLRELMQDILRAEGVAVEEAVLPLVVRAGAGSVRDSLSILDQLLAGSDESGLSYERAVALLGFTDASLLDEITDAFAAADGAAVFRVVNRVIEGGHEPRRFAADMLDRFRDLIVLAAVPDAAQIGLLDLAPDRAERMAGQAKGFGPAGLTRAAELISTGLDQMRGATSPRLLLELMCAQVLLPAAATDEKSLLARLERLESADRGRPASVPQSPPRAPHSGTDDLAERAPVSAPAQQRAPQPRPQPRPQAEPAPSSEPVSPSVPPPPAAAEAPAPQAPGRVAPPPAEPAPAAPAGQSTAALSGADSLRQNWAAILEAVKRERRVASMLLANATVLSLQDGTLTLQFARAGNLKGFTTGGYDADLKRVLSSGFGLNVMVKGVVGEDLAAGGAGLTAGLPGSAGSPGSGPGPADPGRSGQPAVWPPSAQAPPAEDFDPPDEMPPDDEEEMPPDEPSSPGPPPAAPELTGMELIQRELGGQVISEIEG
jgi:DNA polymerase-3 subunit gamma/tau